MKMNLKTKKTFTVYDEQSSPETKTHYFYDDVADNESTLEIAYCGYEALPAKSTRLFDKVTCIECLWVVMQQGDHAKNRLLTMQNLKG